MSTGEECTNCLLVLVAEQRLLADCPPRWGWCTNCLLVLVAGQRLLADCTAEVERCRS